MHAGAALGSLAWLATRKYRDINVALAEGFIQGGPDVPGEGFHYLNPKRLDCKFDPAHPQGFAGSLEGWHNDEPVPFWTLNAWLYIKNPNGLFTLKNPQVP